MRTKASPVAPYSQIAGEYYDHELHKTSRNFDESGRRQMATWRKEIPRDGLVLDAGAGRGRCNEYLDIDGGRIVHLDSSREMLELPDRERSIVRVCHEAEELPFPDSQFSAVAAFLCDPFIGLNFCKEAFRVLRDGGVLIGTTPTKLWGETLRKSKGIDVRTTRFINADRVAVHLPSTLVDRERLEEMLVRSGFSESQISIEELAIAPGTDPVSADISAVACALDRDIATLPILYAFLAKRVLRS